MVITRTLAVTAAALTALAVAACGTTEDAAAPGAPPYHPPNRPVLKNQQPRTVPFK
jgi:hypothetical protein